MVQVTAFESFNMLRVLNFGTIATKATGFAFVDNFNQSVLGTTYEDVAAYEFVSAGYHLAVFGGSNFAFDAENVPTSGTVTGMVLTNGKLSMGIDQQIPSAEITGFSVGAVSLGSAIASADKLDDTSLILNMFHGDDQFYLSSGNDVAFGYDGNDTIYGNAGTDTLVGGNGNDILSGGLGNDRLSGNAGFDTADYFDAATGQTIDLRVFGQQANGDTLSSIEILNGSGQNDVFTAGKYANTFFGNAGSDTLVGGTGADMLHGGTGHDTLTGNAGKDRFFFDEAPSAANSDVITDFTHLQDKIVISSSAFAGLTISHTHPAYGTFYASSSAVGGHDASDRIIYNTSTGVLYYDSDGLNGKAAIEIAHLGTTVHPDLTAGDVVII